MKPQPLNKDIILNEKFINPSGMGFVAYADVLSAKKWAIQQIKSGGAYYDNWMLCKNRFIKILNEAFGEEKEEKE